MEYNDKTIFVVDDELNIRELIKSYLEKDGYRVKVFASAEEVLSVLETESCDMFVIDIMMPGMDGFSLCREIRKTSDVPVIMVSAKDDEIDKVIGLELGGDDYISKPFSPRELLARIRAVFRRFNTTTETEAEQEVEIEPAIINAGTFEISDVSVFPEERKILKGDVEIDLTSKEFGLFVFLAQNKDKVFNREQIINNVWGYDFYGDTRAVDDLIKRVRKKFSDVGSDIKIKTVWGYGYKISD